MKKLMIALVAVAFAAGVQAAQFVWSNTGGAQNGSVYNGSGTSTKLAQGTAVYLFCTADITQSALLEAARGDSFNITTYAIGGNSTTALNASSKVSETSAFDYGSAGNTYTFYWATLFDDKILISDTASAQGQASAAESITFSGSKTWSDVNHGDAAFSSAGWYSVASVPEPTSGLLLLLGMAGLALKRKRA